MQNFFLLIKGLTLMGLSFIGIEILFESNFLHITFRYTSIGWWVLNIASFLTLVLAISKIYSFTKKLLKYIKQKIMR